MGFHEADVPAAEHAAEAPARISEPNGHQGRTLGLEASPLPWPQEADRLIREAVGAALPSPVKTWPTLRNREQFGLVYNQGHKRVSKTLVVFHLDSAADQRVAFVASRVVGGAVQRNRAKRLLRVAFRQVVADRVMPQGWFVLIARGSILQEKSPCVERELAAALDALASNAAGPPPAD